MSTISLKQEKGHSLIGPDLALILVVLIGVLVILGYPASNAGNAYSSLHNTPAIQGNAAGNTSSSEDVSFASDEQYWDANCSHGWSSDSMCDDIVLRTQLCASSAASAYCSDYDHYMQQFYKRKITNFQSL